MKRLALVLPLLLGLACKKPEPVVVYKEVKVAVPVPCPPPSMPRRPVLLTPALPADATPDQQAKALVADIAALMAYSRQLEEALKPYQPSPN